MSRIDTTSKKANGAECHWCYAGCSWWRREHRGVYCPLNKKCLKSKKQKTKRKTFIKDDTKRQINESE